ncbi:hypothetical protein DDZ13_06190 [Coraliomargarita sinensis]|uniref:Uncharacterized protein n=1 Tax=Coraliomargarita sinensis TaxID=2174842 RepID=A0A317ZGQ2_9BACT|nr:hypothetical protein [Coraliomargarita sinensis]PXA04756.1 hypothetical protein DDZ13_06190 [Coraliomargarita sinensis]
MDDFDTFKASREKIDPTSRKFSKRQWQKAYAAYRSSRERVVEKSSAKSSDSSKRHRSRGKSRSSHHASSHNPVLNLRNEVRQNSAYGDLRLMVDLLAWVAIAVVVLVGGVKLTLLTDGIALVALLNTSAKVIAIVVLRLLGHVVIDIPDIALYSRVQKDAKAASEAADTGE